MVYVKFRLPGQAGEGRRAVGVAFRPFFQKAQADGGVEQSGQPGRVGPGPAGQLGGVQDLGPKGVKDAQFGAGNEDPGGPVGPQQAQEEAAVLVAHGQF